jgi:3-hydroxyacyl-CoA dehydrogenase / enoyl-CoA hydratase / 3-hydroxybutyryl-CoA epimerase
VELVTHDRSDDRAQTVARALCGRIGRLPVPVKSAPGFLVNRVLTPYLLEAMLLVDEGVQAEAVDRAATDFGMAMGPVEVADRVGLDICLEVLEMLRDRLGGLPEPPGWFRDKVEKGELGRKSDKGFYAWKDGKPQKADAKGEPDPALPDRLILPMVNASAACLRDKVVEDADLLDGAMIFATGFAPFRGGPAKYARDRGIGEVRERLEALARDRGERFRPDEGLDTLKETP